MNGPCDETDSVQFLEPSEDGGWGGIATAVADMAASVDVHDRRWYLLLEAEICGNPYVALSVHSAAVLAEVRHDQFWYEEGPRLAPGVIDAMTAQGWSAPVSVESGLVNWWHTWPEPYDLDLICHELVRWFATGFALSEDDPVTLSASSGPAHDAVGNPGDHLAVGQGEPGERAAMTEPRRLDPAMATDWSCLDDDDEDPITDEEWDVIEALSGPQDGRPKPKPSAEA